jgi:hypothetical protein
VSNSWQTATTATQQLAVFTHGAVGALPAVRVAHVPHLAWQQGSRVGGGGDAVSTPRPTVARPNSNGYFGRWNSARRRGVGKALGRRWLQVRGGPVGHRVRCVGEDEEGVASAASGGCVLSGVCAQARCVSPRGNRACSTRARRARRRAVHTRSRGGAFRQLSESDFVS